MPTSNTAFIYLTVYEPFPFPGQSSGGSVDDFLLTGESKTDPEFVAAEKLIDLSGGHTSLTPTIDASANSGAIIAGLVFNSSLLIPNFNDVNAAITSARLSIGRLDSGLTLKAYSIDSNFQFHDYTSADAGTFDYAHWTPPYDVITHGTIIGTSQDDNLVGTAGSDSFQGLQGNDTIDGKAGVDTAIYSGPLASYTIAQIGSTIVVSDSVVGRDGIDTLTNVEQVKFSDITVIFDLHSTKDKLVYEIYQAAYGRTPDSGGFRFWAVNADSNNLSAVSLADAFISAQEFKTLYGVNPTNTDYVTELYTNVLGRAPDPAGLTFWIGKANAGEARDLLLIDFATSNENASIIGSHTSNGYWTT